MGKLSKRDLLIQKLNITIQEAEETAFKDPEVRSMVNKIRKAYHEDSDGFMFMIGATPAPASANEHPGKKIPQSKIPQLLLILDSLANKKPLPFQKREILKGLAPPILHDASNILEFPSPPTNGIQTLPIPELSQAASEQLHEIELQIEKLKNLYFSLKEQEYEIKYRKGKFSIPVERLKAERYLRELPETIKHLQSKKQMIEDGLL